jgi:SAM-dependent methyltransferase
VPLVRFDAQALPFRDRSFDLVVSVEAIYYLPDAGRFVGESLRVLAPGGRLLIATVNKDWSEFAPSAFSTRYFSVPELRFLLAAHGFGRVEFFGAFSTMARTVGARVRAAVRRAAVKLGLMPGTLAARERLKRLVYGPLTALASEVSDGMAELQPLVPLAATRPTTEYKILYAVAHTVGD